MVEELRTIANRSITANVDARALRFFGASPARSRPVYGDTR